MRPSLFDTLCAVVCGGVLAAVIWAQGGNLSKVFHPAPLIVPVPMPAPPSDRHRRPWRDSVQDGIPLIGEKVPQVDFPSEQWIRNIGSKVDGAGMCVFTSFEMACLWAGLEEFRGFRDWCAAKYPGGGYPEKLAQLIDAYCQAKSIKKPLVIQYTGSDPDFLKVGLKNGWMPCTTLYHSPRYGSGVIYHMVCCAHLDGTDGAIQDNNFQPLEWATEAETVNRIKLKGEYWGVLIVSPGPPPSPANKE